MQPTTRGQADTAITQEYKLHEYDRLCSELEKQLDRRDHIDGSGAPGRWLLYILRGNC